MFVEKKRNQRSELRIIKLREFTSIEANSTIETLALVFVKNESGLYQNHKIIEPCGFGLLRGYVAVIGTSRALLLYQSLLELDTSFILQESRTVTQRTCQLALGLKYP